LNNLSNLAELSVKKLSRETCSAFRELHCEANGLGLCQRVWAITCFAVAPVFRGKAVADAF
jgi:hypothetical protein